MGGNQNKEKTEEQIREDMKRRWDNFSQSKEVQSEQQKKENKDQNDNKEIKKKEEKKINDKNEEKNTNKPLDSINELEKSK